MTQIKNETIKEYWNKRNAIKLKLSRIKISLENINHNYLTPEETEFINSLIRLTNQFINKWPKSNEIIEMMLKYAETKIND